MKALFENNPSGEGEFDGEDLATFTKLNPKTLNDAVEYLDSKGFLNRQDFLGTTPFDFGHVSLNVHGKHFYHKQNSSKATTAKKPRIVKNKNAMKIFLSHSN